MSSPDQNTEQLALSLEDLFEPPLLVMLESLLGDIGFACAPYKEYPNPPKGNIGWYTVPGRRTLYYNPHHVRERGPIYSFPIFAHEIGHHRPEVMALQDAIMAAGKSYAHFFRNIAPVEKIIGILNNIAADIYLEAANSQRIYRTLMENLYRRALAQDVLPEEIFTAHEGPWTRENFPWEKAVQENAPAFQHFCNGLLLIPKFGMPPAGTFPEQVQKALEKAYQHIQAIQDTDRFKSPLAAKVYSQIKIYELAAEMVNKDLDNMQDAAMETGETLADLLKNFEDMLDEQLGDHSIFQIVEDLEDGENGPGTGIPGAEEGGQKGQGQKSEGKGKEKDPQKMLQDIRDALSGIGASLLEMEAKNLGVKPEALKSYREYVAKYLASIQTLTQIFIDILLRPRELQTSAGNRDGFMIEPGMEFATYAGIITGDLEPPTMLDQFLKQKLLRLEAAFALDTSGSMFPYTAGMLGILAVLMESVRQIHETVLAQSKRYNFSPGDPMPARLELSTFADNPELILAMSDILDLATVVKKFNEMQTAKTGGTATDKILRFEYNRLTKDQDGSVLRMLVLITDSMDEGPALNRIIQKIVEDPRIYFLVIGVGPNKEVRASIEALYRKHLKPQYQYRVFAQGFEKIEQALIPLLEFFRKSLAIEQEKLDAQIRGCAVMSG